MKNKKLNDLPPDFNKKRKNGFEGKNKNVQLPGSPAFLIILMGSLGDVARGLCLVSQIKNSFPKSAITWLVEPKCKEAVTFHPLIDDILVFDRANWKKGLKDIFHELRTRRFDCVLDLQRHFKSGVFSFLSGAKYRIGFHPGNTKEGNWLFNNTYIPCLDDDYSKLFHYLKFTEYLGCHPEYLPSESRAMFESRVLDFGFSGPGLPSLAADILSRIKKPFIAMVLGSSWVSKEWPAERYARLIHDLVETTSLHIVMVDTPAKQRMACELERAIDSGRLINLVGRTSLLELAAVLKEAELAVGPDCGSAHIAAAVGTLYVALFGPTSPQRTAPFGSEHLIVSKHLACAPCYKKKCPGKDTICMRSIEAGDVKVKVLQVLKDIPGISAKIAENG